MMFHGSNSLEFKFCVYLHLQVNCDITMKRFLLIFALLLLICPLARSERADNYLPDNPNVVIDSTNLPIVWIDVDGKMIMRYHRIDARMKIIHNGKGRYNYADTIAHPGQNIDYEGHIALRYRGRSSYFNSDKKPMSFRTLAQPYTPLVFDKKKVEILGMGKDNNWAFIAPYSDRSMIRDLLTFELARPWMEYTPQGRLCEVYLDGVYYGVYILCEVVSKGKHRLDLPDPGEEGDELTGGYIVEVGPNDRPYHVSTQHPVTSTGQAITDSYIYFRYDWPDYEDMTANQVNYINGAIDRMDSVFASADYKNPETGYRKYIDVQSFMDFQLFNELSHNPDGYRQSAKFFKRRDSEDPRFKMVLWDFNLAYGNCSYNRGWYTSNWVYQQNAYLHTGGNFLVPFYWYKMWKDDSYVAARKERWAQLRAGNLRSDRLMATIDSLTNEITSGGAEYRNDLARPRWGQKLWPNRYVPSSYEDEINYLKGWITERIAWLDARFDYTEPPLPPPPPPTPVRGDVNADGEVNIADVNTLIAIILGSLDKTEGRSDVNGDGEVGLADVNALIDLILSSP